MISKNKVNKAAEAIDSVVTVALTSGKKVWSKATSEKVKNELAPNWSKFLSGLHFRGTFNELLSQKLDIHIYRDTLPRKLLGEKTVNLRTFLRANVIKTDILLYKNTQLTTLRGILRTPFQPRYLQRDFSDSVISGEYYLVVHLQKIDVFSSLEDRGDFGVYATVEWGGILIRSKTVRSPLINEMFHFNIPISTKDKIDENRLIDFLNNDLQTKASIRFNIWVDYGDNVVDNVGTAYCGLANLYNAEADEKQFTDALDRRKKSFMTRIYNGTTIVESAFMDTSSCKITFGIWFQPDIPPEVDLSKLYDIHKDVFPFEFREKLDTNKQDNFLMHWKDNKSDITFQGKKIC